MAIPPADYRNAMARLGAAVNIVTSDGAAGIHGLTVSAVCSISDDPATILVCINRASRGYLAVRKNGVLCVNILGPGHAELSARFARSVTDIDERFGDRAAWMTMPSGSLGLKGRPSVWIVQSFVCSTLEPMACSFARPHTCALALRAKGWCILIEASTA